MTRLYKFTSASGTVDIRDKKGWKQWAVEFYNDIGYYELVDKKKSDNFIPRDWWQRINKILKLEEI